MPKKTKKEKIAADHRGQYQFIAKTESVSLLRSDVEINELKAIRYDVGKTLILSLVAIAIEVGISYLVARGGE